MFNFIAIKKFNPMSGHNKWSTIKRKKGALDAKRSKIFSRILKEIAVAVRENGADPDGNAKLRLAISNAKGVNLPKETLMRAINKANDKDSAQLIEVTHEGYAHGGVAIIVECLTDNTQRTLSNVRACFTKYSGALGTNGCLNFVFDRKGIFTVPKGNLNEDDFIMEVIDSGAEDVELEEEFFTITTAFEDFGAMMKKLEEMKIEPESAKLERIPNTLVKLNVDAAKKVLRLIDLLEEDDDVQSVYHNIEMTEEIADAMDN